MSNSGSCKESKVTCMTQNVSSSSAHRIKQHRSFPETSPEEVSRYRCAPESQEARLSDTALMNEHLTSGSSMHQILCRHPPTPPLEATALLCSHMPCIYLSCFL